jgi:aryl-alcohol dehydrogenase-like predicted oxidoreductase
LKYRQLGASDLRISIISLGSWLTFSGGVEKRQALACIHKALDLGINFIDTANVYGRGAAESVLGEALRGIDRTSYILATKVFFPMSDADRGLSRAQIGKQLDASLKRLGTDYVDAPPPAGTRAGHASMGAMLPKEWLRAPVLTAVQQVKLIAERETGLSLSQFALAWVLRRQEVSSAIIGASRPEQVTENAAAADCEVAPELFARAEEILAPFR